MLTVFVAVTACAPRGEIQYGKPASNSVIKEIWVTNFRPIQAPEDGQQLPPRPTELQFQMNQVSIPPGHQPGSIEWPRGEVDANKDFVTLSTQSYRDINIFASNVASADMEKTDETVLFVHGYNTTHGEAVYQLAQISHDFELPSPAVLFSWPSAGLGAGYIYDRDSVLIARDQLEQVIMELTRRRGRKVVLVGHSMGNFLIMETLRQIEISRSLDIDAKISALFMIAPDIDGELFRTQALRLKKMPEPSVILAADQDRALRLSALITGRTNRLGSQTDRSTVSDLPISVIDVSDLSKGGLGHSIPMTSPAAITILKKIGLNTKVSGTRIPPLLDLGDFL
ncbi:MAG: alpha/beta fold hydrolase [Sulfitobacter sp.]